MVEGPRVGFVDVMVVKPPKLFADDTFDYVLVVAINVIDVL